MCHFWVHGWSDSGSPRTHSGTQTHTPRVSHRDYSTGTEAALRQDGPGPGSALPEAARHSEGLLRLRLGKRDREREREEITEEKHALLVTPLPLSFTLRLQQVQCQKEEGAPALLCINA